MVWPAPQRPDHRKKGEGSPGWSWRRAVVNPLIMYACFRLSVMENAPDTLVNQTIAWWWWVIIISCVFFYTGFATAQDIVAIVATRTGLPYADPPQYYQQTTTVAPADPSMPVTTTTTVAPQVPVTEPVLDEPGPGARP